MCSSDLTRGAGPAIVEDERTTSASASRPTPDEDGAGDRSDATGALVPKSPDNTQLLLNVDSTGGMSEAAYLRYKECIVKFASALAREASRLEEADRAEDIDRPEITATMVVKANELIRHPPSTDTSPGTYIIAAQALSFAAAMLTPIFGSELHSVWQWVVTIICGTVALASQIFAIIAVRRR